jgi:two-component sensor histidine kinase
MRGMSVEEVEAELTTILEGIGEGFYSVDGQWRVTRLNAVAARHFRRAAEDMVGRVLWDMFPAARETALGKLFLDTMASRRPVASETPSVVFDGPWLAFRLFPLKDGMGIVFRDITDRKRAERHREVLISELDHRVKNALAMSQAIAAQTLRAAGVPAELRQALDARLATLGNVNNVVTDPSWQNAEFAAIVDASLKPHRVAGRDSIAISGPGFRARRQGAVAVSMALHELATNATKYGALSFDGGTVTLAWRLDGDRFHLRWEEQGGPPVTPPARKGFGSVLIEQVVPAELRGEAQIAYAPTGVVYRIDAPLHTLAADGS